LAPRGVKVSGRLTGVSAPLSGAVQLRGKVPDIQSALGVVDLQYMGQVPIASDGSFVFEKVLPGSYEFRATLVPTGAVFRSIVISGHDLERVEVQLSNQEIAMLQGARIAISL